MTIITISGCINEISEAPGCNHSPFLGGCFGTRIIKNLTVEPEVSCLKIEANNCNDDGIRIVNYCMEPVIVGGIVLEKSQLNEYNRTVASDNGIVEIDAERTSSGEIIVRSDRDSDFKPYEPEFDALITLNGTIGNTSIEISYVKTKSLC